MQINYYQRKAEETAVYQDKIIYPVLGLFGEAGEVAEKIKKWVRGDYELTEEKKQELAKELGDVLWYIAALSTDLGLDLNEIAQINLEKLNKRKKENKIRGDGDNR